MHVHRFALFRESRLSACKQTAREKASRSENPARTLLPEISRDFSRPACSGVAIFRF